MKRSTFKVAFYLKRNQVKKSGLMAIVARVSINTQRVNFSTKLEIEERLWSTSNGKAIGTSIQSKEINRVLEEIRYRITDIYNNETLRGEVPSATTVKNIFFGKDESQQTLLTLFEENNENIKSLIGIDTTLVTYKKYELVKRRVTDFLKHRYQLSDIRPKKITLDFLYEFEIYLRTICKLSHNVTGKHIMLLKKIVTIAFNRGLIQTNTFAPYRIKMQKVDRGYLTKEELETIQKKEIDIERLDILRDIFLFCCWTGLSYIDVRNLKHSDLRHTDDGEIWTDIKRQKTGAKVEVPLLEIPRKIIDKYRDKAINGSVLPVLSNQKCNAYLKELADICSIKKNLTFHMSRHTFATTVTLSNGVPIETVSRMLGHSNLKITQIYAKITNDKVRDDMSALANKLDGFGSSYIR